MATRRSWIYQIPTEPEVRRWQRAAAIMGVIAVANWIALLVVIHAYP